MTEQDFTRAIADRNWYAIASIALWALVWLWRRFDGRLYPKIPARWQFLVPLVLAAATGFVDAYLSKLSLKDALLRALWAVFSMGAVSMGVHSALQNSKIPYVGLTAAERKRADDDTTPNPPDGGLGSDIHEAPTLPAAKDSSSGPSSAAIIFVFALVCAGCAGSLGEARKAGAPQRALSASKPDEVSARCITLDDRRSFYGGIGKTFAVLGGGAGIATITTDDERLQTGLAIGAAASAAVAAGAIYISESAGDSWVKECE